MGSEFGVGAERGEGERALRDVCTYKECSSVGLPVEEKVANDVENTQLSNVQKADR